VIGARAEGTAAVTVADHVATSGPVAGPAEPVKDVVLTWRSWCSRP
jgi:hypothetical protein